MAHWTVLNSRDKKIRKINIFAVFVCLSDLFLLLFLPQMQAQGLWPCNKLSRDISGQFAWSSRPVCPWILSPLLDTSQAALWAGQSCRAIVWTAGPAFHSGVSNSRKSLFGLLDKTLSFSWDQGQSFTQGPPRLGIWRKMLKKRKPSYLLWM